MNLMCFLRRAVIVLLILVLIGWLFPREAFAEPNAQILVQELIHL
jgi:hypothetical protein